LYRTYNLANAASDLKDRLFFVKAFTFGVIIAVMSRDDALVARDSIFVLDSVTMRTGWIYAAELEKA